MLEFDRERGSNGSLGAEVELDDPAEGTKDSFSPREIMRSRHPDLFSDSMVQEVNRFPKESFEYHLDTLTSRKQEQQFEYFCRKLAEKEICPNLRVQTGPTGGGDSKVDTETYPVAPEIAERWWVGSPSSGAERWAFAFSAKKEWSSKIRADVDSILSTGRDYKRIYFFTNQLVSDKKRADTEDKLSKKAGVPVHIVDRAWIVDKAYGSDNRTLGTYLAALGVEGGRRETVDSIGPRDSERRMELDALDHQIADATRYTNARYQLVEDCLRGAILSRNLERSRAEVDGRFLHAERLSRDVNHLQQQLRIAYNRAWTAFWWYEDYEEFTELYGRVEGLARESDLASDIELLLNLWLLLPPSVAAGRISSEKARMESRSDNLTMMLTDMVDDAARPNNSLFAQTNLIVLNTVKCFYSDKQEEAGKGWRELSEVVHQATELAEYSVTHLFGLVTELGEYVDGPEFDALYQKLTEIMSRRRSEGTAGLAYLTRAMQKLRQDKPYQAIAWFGRAEECLFKDEYRDELFSTLIGISYAFERAGLLWAARHNALAASNQALIAFKDHGRITIDAFVAVNRLAWVELAMGRIPHSLNAIVLARSIASQLNLSEAQQEAYSEDLGNQELILCIHLLRAPLNILPHLTRLPDALQRLGFRMARMALLFGLGHERTMRDEGFIREEDSTEEVEAFFERWVNSPAGNEAASTPLFFVDESSVLTSTILGSDVVLEVPNTAASLGVAESVLSALEAFVATSDELDVLPRGESFTLSIRESDQVRGMPQVRFADDGIPRAELLCPKDFHEVGRDRRSGYADWLQETLLTLACRILIARDAKAWLERVAVSERGLARALILGDVFTLTGNVFGSEQRSLLKMWLDNADRCFPAVRTRAWHEGKAPESGSYRANPYTRSGEDSERLFDRERLRHTDRRVRSVIDIELWDRAQWRGTVFISYPSGPPVLAIAFANGEAGNAIFRAWKERWGTDDQDDNLRVSIVTKVSKERPLDYSIVVGPSLQQTADDRGKIIMSVSRCHRMVPKTPENLSRFLEAYNREGRYFLGPAKMGDGEDVFEIPSMEFAICKWHLNTREAWEIGDDDPDRVALLVGDETCL